MSSNPATGHTSPDGISRLWIDLPIKEEDRGTTPRTFGAMTMKTARPADAPHKLTTDPVTAEVRAARPPPADAVTALRVVGEAIELPLPRAKDSFTLGRAPASEVDLSVPKGDVSRLHCVLRRSGGEITVTDAGSTHGIVVRGRSGAGSLRAGDRFTVGKTELIALDDAMQVLRPALLRYLGFDAHRAVDDVLTTLAALDDRSLHDERAILIVAPRGSEAELLAKAIHDGSTRRRHRFVAFSLVAVGDRDLTTVLKSASDGTVLVDLVGVGPGRARASLVNALVSNTYRTRAIFVCQSEHAAQSSTSPVVLRWERITVPPVAARPGDIAHLLNAMLVELGSQRRVEELPPARVADLATHGWLDNHVDLRRAAERLQALLENNGNISAASRSMKPALTPASLSEYLTRIGAIDGKRR